MKCEMCGKELTEKESKLCKKCMKKVHGSF
jgi:NMD protein affecting ribosome stability and mRNA decay